MKLIIPRIIKHHLILWLAILIGLPLFVKIDQYCRNISETPNSFISQVIFISILLFAFASIFYLGFKLNTIWKKIICIVLESIIFIIYIYLIAFWALTLPGADTL